MEVRLAEPLDAEGIFTLMEALARFERLEPPSAEAKARLVQDAWPGVGEPRVAFWVATTGQDTVVAYAAVIFTYSTFLARPTLYLEDLFVHPDHRRRGVASLLLDRLEAVGRERGCGRMEWTVLDWNEGAIALYERRGAQFLSDWRLMRQPITL